MGVKSDSLCHKFPLLRIQSQPLRHVPAYHVLQGMSELHHDVPFYMEDPDRQEKNACQKGKSSNIFSTRGMPRVKTGLSEEVLRNTLSNL